MNSNAFSRSSSQGGGGLRNQVGAVDQCFQSDIRRCHEPAAVVFHFGLDDLWNIVRVIAVRAVDIVVV